MKWTDQQERAITEKGQDILVSAAAGSGKTAVLTERIKRLILDDGISVENMLVVTFSNAAASEMKEKIIKALKKAIEEDGSRASYLRSQIRKASTSDISTFHKFAMGVIRRYFYVTDVESDFSICDDSRRQIMIGQVLDELIEDRFAGVVYDASGQKQEEPSEAESARFEDFLRHYCSVKNEDALKEMILEVYRFIMSMPDPFEWLDRAAVASGMSLEEFRKSSVYDHLLKSSRDLVQKAIAVYELVMDDISGMTSLEPKGQKDLDALNAILAAIDSGDEAAIARAASYKFETFRAGKDDKASYSLVSDAVKGRRQYAKDLVAAVSKGWSLISVDQAVKRVQDTEPYALYLAELVKDFHRRFTEKKRTANLLDFNDLEHTALEILRHQEIAEIYRNHFEVIYIDEYQDSSILQETLISCISRGNNVYMVGDVKQSIYKFRLAEPEIFTGKYNDFRSGRRPGLRIDLNANFRSKRSIIEATNGIFKNIMNRSLGGIDYDDDAALHQGLPYDGPHNYPASLHLIDTTGIELSENGNEANQAEADNNQSGAGENRPTGTGADSQTGAGDDASELEDLKGVELEARMVAALAAERVGREIYDQKEDRVRKAGPGDIVILMRAVKGYADIYANALRDAGLQSFIDEGEGYFETSEIEIFMNLLRIIDNFRRDIPLLSALRSAIFGFSIEELIQIRLLNRDRSVSYSEAFIEYSKLDNPLGYRCADVLDRINVWREDARYMSLEDFLWKLMRETAFPDYVSAMPGGDRRAANLKALIDKAVDFSSTQSKGLYGFIDYVESMNKNKISVGQAKQTGDTDNMVRIMTIHKSKGLEFPFVIVSGVGRRFNTRQSTTSVLLHKDLGMGLKYSDPTRHIYSDTIVQRAITDCRLNEQLAEEMRILYVAMTRPQDELIMTAAVKDLDKYLDAIDSGTRGGRGKVASFLDWILPYSDQAGIEVKRTDRGALARTENESLHSLEDLKNAMEKGFPDFKDTDGKLDMLKERFDYQYPYSDDVFSKSKFSVSELNRAIGRGEEDSGAVETAVPVFVKGRQKITAAMRGTLVHKVMELIPFKEDMSEEEIGSFVNSLPEKGLMTEEEAACVDISKLAAFFSSDIGKRACRATVLKREWAFTLRKNREELIAMAEDKDQAAELKAQLPPEVLIQGIIDCCFMDEEGIVILDYKTNYVNPMDKEGSFEHLRKEYTNQLLLYSEVVEKSLGEPVNQRVLFLVDSGDVLTL